VNGIISWKAGSVDTKLYEEWRSFKQTGLCSLWMHRGYGLSLTKCTMGICPLGLLVKPQRHDRPRVSIPALVEKVIQGRQTGDIVALSSTSQAETVTFSIT